MEHLLLIIIGILLLIIFALVAKVYFLRRSAQEIAEAFRNRLTADTNTLIDISTRDPYMQKLAADINVQLRLLRKQRQNYLSGDRELKDALTNISHDLRTPLTAISGYLDLLEREEVSDDVRRYLTYITDRTEAMKQLTEELFRYSVILSAKEDPEIEPLSLNGVLEESIAGFYAVLTEQGIVPEIDLPDTPVIRHLNKASLSRIFANLLNNACKYSDGDLNIRMDETGTITFTNTAAALDEVAVGRLFDRFFTIEAARNSTGLGLSIAKTLTEQMGGTISAVYKNEELSVIICFRS